MICLPCARSSCRTMVVTRIAEGVRAEMRRDNLVMVNAIPAALRDPSIACGRDVAQWRLMTCSLPDRELARPPQGLLHGNDGGFPIAAVYNTPLHDELDFLELL